jgi:methionyl-tRNA formyltransferase
LISREWSSKIFENIYLDKELKIKNKFIFYTNKKYIKNLNISKKEKKKVNQNKLDSNLNILKRIQPDLIFAFGWSGYLSKKIRSIAPCLILHPSKLPKFRGGTPIQNQLVRGIKNSSVSIIEADDIIDTGKIFFQKKISLKGYLDNIHNEIISKGIIGAKKIIKLFRQKKLKSKKQNNKLASYYPGRTPDMSEIFIKDFKKYEAEYFYNLIRGLQKPYPMAYVRCKNNSKLYFERVFLKKNRT